MFRNTGANALAKNQTRLAYEDKRDLYCMCRTVSKGARGESNEFSDTSTTDTAELEELDSTDWIVRRWMSGKIWFVLC